MPAPHATSHVCWVKMTCLAPSSLRKTNPLHGSSASAMMSKSQHVLSIIVFSLFLPTATAFTGLSSHHVRTHAKWQPAVSPLKSSHRVSLSPSRAGAARMAFGAAGEEEVDCLVIGSTLGGNIETKKEGDYTWEDGPNTFQPVDNMLKLVEELGLADQLITTDPKLPRYVYSDDDMYALPAGGGPPKDLVRLLSPFALVRAAFGAVLPTSSSSTDETVADFISRSLGGEVLDKIVDPFISTVYTGNPQKMSFQSVFPGIKKIADDANQPGGLLRSFISSRIAAKKAKRDAPAASSIPPSPRYHLPLSSSGISQPACAGPDAPPSRAGASASLKGGLHVLPAAAATYLGEAARPGWRVTELAATDANTFSATVATAAGETKTVTAKSVVVATPSGPAASLLAPLAPAAAMLSDIVSPPVFAVTLAYSSSALDTARPCSTEGRLQGFGVLVPRSAQLNSLGFQFISSMFPERRPEGEEVVLSYYGGAQNAGVTGMSAEEVVEKVHADARKILLKSDAAAPKVLSVRAWDKAIPQYNVGHSKLMGEVRASLPEGVLVTGSYAGGGVSLGDCVGSGMQSAAHVLALLAK